MEDQKKRPNLVTAMLKKKYQSEEVQEMQPSQIDSIPDFKNIKSAAEMIGAYKTFEINRLFSRIMQGRLLEEMKQGKRYRYIGYQNFDAFCQEELHISSRKAEIILAERNKLGAIATEALIKIGLRPKDLKVITRLKEDNEVEVTQEKIKFEDMEIEISPDNLGIIQEVVNKFLQERNKQKKALETLTKKHEENDLKIKELEVQLSAPIPVEITEFQTSLEPIKTQFIALYSRIAKIKKQVENDPGKFSLLKGLIADLDLIGSTQGDALLGEGV